jgi:large subunit ribosomal protein L3e
LTTVWSAQLSDAFKRRFYKNWYSSKKKAFSKYIEKYSNEDFASKIARLQKYCTVIRLIVHTQPQLLKNLGTKKASVLEVQVNGGQNIGEKIAFAKQWLEKDIKVNDVLNSEQLVDVIGVTKGRGFTGTIKRWGTKLLQRKSHRGSRKIGCIGAWHPSRVSWTTGRAGQGGYHHRTEPGKKIYRIGKAANEGVLNNATTENDLTEKNITPLGGFPHYGVVNHDYIMLKGCCIGTKQRPLILRHQIHDRTTRAAQEKITLRFIDTSSKLGHGKFQTHSEKARFYGKE